MKTVVEQKPLFETLSAEESANVNGAWGNYYYYPCFVVPVHHGSWGGGSGSGSSITQTTNVNILIED